MADDDKGSRKSVQVINQPVDVADVQIVGRFIQDQDLGLLQEQFGQDDLGPLAARELGHVMVIAQIRQAKAAGHALDFRVQIVKIAFFQVGLDLPGLLQQLVIPAGRVVRVQLVQAGLLRVQVVKGSPQEFADRQARRQLGILVQVAHRDLVLPLDLAVVWEDLPRQDLDQGGLANPILPRDPHVVLFIQDKAGALIQGLFREALAQIIDCQ